MIPDAEKLVGNYLRGVLGTRVRGSPPDEDQRVEPWVMLTQLDADNDPEVTPDYLITYMLQLDCYAGKTGGHPEAVHLGGSVRQALAVLNGAGTILGGSAVVTSVRFSSHARVPDTQAFEPARERIVLDALVTMHPV